MRRVWVWALCAVCCSNVLWAAGCAEGPGVPGWARHIKAPSIDREGPTDRIFLVLEREMGPKALNGASYTPAEEIAALGVRELVAGNEWDAALLVSMASYRLHQEAYLAYVLGEKEYKTRPDLNRAVYSNLVSEEIRRFNDANWIQELGLLRADLRGDVQLLQALMDLASQARQGDGAEQEAARQEVVRRFRAVANPKKEKLVHRALAEAYLRRLQEDAAAGDEYAFYYLAATPLDAFRLAALRGTTKYFVPVLVDNMAPMLGRHRGAVREALRADSGKTRAMAAVILGANRNIDDLPLLDWAAAAEKDPRARFAMLHALAQHGRKDALTSLVAALKTCDGDECEQAMLMIRWLPFQVETSVGQAPIIKVLTDYSQTAGTRAAAAAIIGDIGAKEKLPDWVIFALVRAVVAGKLEVAWSAMWAFARIQQLDSRYLARVYASDASARPAILKRWERIAAPEDLSFLVEQYATANDETKVRIINVIRVIEGPAAKQQLATWLLRTQQTELELPLAFALFSRRDVDAPALDRWSTRTSGGKKMLLQLFAANPEAKTTAKEVVKDGAPMDLLDLAVAAPFSQTNLSEELWELASYHDARYYPADIVVRQNALAAIMRLTVRDQVARQTLERHRASWSPGGQADSEG